MQRYSLQHTATHCNSLQHTMIRKVPQSPCSHAEVLTATHCNSLQLTATHVDSQSASKPLLACRGNHCNTLQIYSYTFCSVAVCRIHIFLYLLQCVLHCVAVWCSVLQGGTNTSCPLRVLSIRPHTHPHSHAHA